MLMYPSQSIDVNKSLLSVNQLFDQILKCSYPDLQEFILAPQTSSNALRLMCITWTGSSFHPFSCTCLLAILVCQYHTFGLLFKHQLADLQVSSFSAVIYLCGFLNKLQLFPIQTAPVLQEKLGRALQATVQRQKTFLSSLSLTQEKALLRIQFLQAEPSKRPLNVYKKVSDAFSVKFTLITSFWPRKHPVEEQGKYHVSTNLLL